MKKKETHDLCDNGLFVGSKVQLEYSWHTGVIISINPHNKYKDINTYTVMLDPIVVLWPSLLK